MEVNVKSLERATLVWQVFLRTLMITSPIYLAAQIYFAIATLIGLGLALGIDSSLILKGLDKISFETVSGAGGALLLIGMVGAMLCGLLTFVISAALFLAGRCRAFRGFSLLILTICTIGLLIPVINLFPIMWLWNLYVGWTNRKDAQKRT